MGNRAEVIIANTNERFPRAFEVSPGIYLHWNGGPESVFAFMKVLLDTRKFADERGLSDAQYAAARYVGVVQDFFDSDYWTGTSLGIHNLPTKTRKVAHPYREGEDMDEYFVDLDEVSMNHDPGDNGVYIFYGDGTYEWTGGFNEYYTGCVKPDGTIQEAFENLQGDQRYEGEIFRDIVAELHETKPTSREYFKLQREAAQTG